jgi:hypothetical protein
MSQDPNPTGGAGGTSGGATGGNPDPKPDHVSRNAYDDAVTEAKRAKERAANAEAELERIRLAEKKKADDEALKRGEHEKVIAEKEKEAEDLRKKLADVEEERLANRKLAAFNKGIGTTLEQRWHHLWDPDEIKTNADGSVNADSLNKYVEKFKTTYPETLGKAAGKGVPAPDAVGDSGVITDEQWRNFTPKERKENHARYAEQLRAARK